MKFTKKYLALLTILLLSFGLVACDDDGDDDFDEPIEDTGEEIEDEFEEEGSIDDTKVLLSLIVDLNYG